MDLLEPGALILFGAQAATEGPRARVHLQVVTPIEGAGLLVVGWLSDPAGEVARITLEADDLPALDLLTQAAIFARMDAPSVFGTPHGVVLSWGFVALLAGTAIDIRARVGVQLTTGAVTLQALERAGDPDKLAELIARAPQDFALAVLAHLSAARASLPARPMPLFDRAAQFVFQRIDAGFDYGHGHGESSAAVICHVDQAMRIGDRGILLKGWLLSDPLDSVVSITAVSLSGRRGEMTLPLPKLGRPDVLHSRIPEGLMPDPDCGLVAFAAVPGLPADDRLWFLNIVMRRGTIRRVPFTCGPSPGPQAAISGIVSLAESSAVDFSDLFARALAPALDWAWARLRADRPVPVVIDFGDPPVGAAVSIIVPLFGRMDFVRHQIASFSNDPDFRPGAAIAELIYVLDDPTAEAELLPFCRLLWDIYGVPFRLVLQKGNFGYSAANNAGARFATGQKILLLNSDVMPKHGRWVSTLARLYGQLSGCGVLGCRLLYEDGSIQHAGMNFRPSLLLDGSWSNEHSFKGLSTAFDPHAQTEAVAGVTGACLLIERTLFQLIGGMSEAYVIGDFEDSDLCLRVHERGLKIYYTPLVELYHLERQSMNRIGQGHLGWRQSLTLFNMWKHGQRWQALIPGLMHRYDPDGVHDADHARRPPARAPATATSVHAMAPEPEISSGPVLVDFTQLGAGQETTILPAGRLPARTHFSVFPTASDTLVPAEPGPLTIDVPRAAVFEVEDVGLHGFRLFERKGSLFNDHSLVDPGGQASADFAAKFADGQSEDVVLDADAMPVPAGPVQEMDGGDCLILSSDEPANFGSWIYRFAAKLALAQTQAPVRRVFAYDDGRWMRPVMQLLDPEIEVLPHAPDRSYRIAHARIASLPAPHVFFRQEIIEQFHAIVARIGEVSGLPERLYVSRRKQALLNPGLRVLENETELVERLGHHGFVEFFPEDHDLTIQVAAFAQARLIVSPGGSNLFCAVFAQHADFILDIESSDTWSYAHMNLLASTGRPFSTVYGRRTGRGDAVHGNWVVDTNALVEGLQALAILKR